MKIHPSFRSKDGLQPSDAANAGVQQPVDLTFLWARRNPLQKATTEPNEKCESGGSPAVCARVVAVGSVHHVR